jgi:hypothetical protein
MIDYNALFEFSRSHCISICAFLVPANLLTTANTLITWFLIGVVMPPTFVLLFLGSVCLLANLWAVLARKSMARLLVTIYRICTRVDLLVFRQLHE